VTAVFGSGDFVAIVPLAVQHLYIVKGYSSVQEYEEVLFPHVIQHLFVVKG
jgi:hypothetical protein